MKNTSESSTSEHTELNDKEKLEILEKIIYESQEIFELKQEMQELITQKLKDNEGNH